MTTVQFDDAAADAVMRAAIAASDTLRGQGGPRRAAAESALDDFDGAYADRFRQAVLDEAQDRPKLASTLDELAGQVRTVASQAARERERIRDLAAWETRDAQRRASAAEGTLEAVGAWGAGVFDPKPADTPVVPTPISATFSARRRTRTGDGTSTGRSSARPAALRSFARVSRSSDTAAGDRLETLRTAWAAFTASCGWARVDSVSCITGFREILAENAEDASWLDRIADAFERAGGSGSLANTALDIAASGTLPPALRKVLAAGLTPEQVVDRWSALGWSNGTGSKRDLAALPLAVQAAIGNLEGAPHWARDAANRTVLAARLRDAERTHDPQFAALKDITASLRTVDGGAPRQLIALTADEPPLAAVSIGDLATADSVTWAVPGMGSSTEKMTNWTDAAQNVFDEQHTVDKGKTHAVVAWMGYKAPAVPVAGGTDFGVFDTKAAAAGAPALVASIQGLAAVRADRPPRTAVLGHSYGSTTAAIALSEGQTHVDAFVTVGSAGIPDDIASASDIDADAMFSGQARNVIPFLEGGKGDQWAHVGREFSSDHHTDPTQRGFGSTPFNTDGSDDGRAVGDHGVHTDDQTGYLDPGTESLLNVARATTDHGDDLTPYEPAGPTLFEQGLANSRPVP
ncbi:hypothetical protein HUN59_16120 [Curtobacterium sp. Csp2]|uniref:alpha/beta hydrolase n=1 Tax=Curtobacterium sp. Csp2 TaxID=2495430 RepID=UPI001580A38C|nr:alpha/beta hydrolase [Curtobacterium sp. Csp2]QKS17530.1 hypothetical protein HUN59_16120 [Curtobacterium sp. Csp2]